MQFCDAILHESLAQSRFLPVRTRVQIQTAAISIYFYLVIFCRRDENVFIQNGSNQFLQKMPQRRPLMFCIELRTLTIGQSITVCTADLLFEWFGIDKISNSVAN